MKLLAIYDNGGKTLDRYTFVTDDITSFRDGAYSCLATDVNGRGFSQWCGATMGRHLGKKVKFEDLSAELQQHVNYRLYKEGEDA